MRRSVRALALSALLVTLLVASSCSSGSTDEGGQGGSATTAPADGIDRDGVIRVGYDLAPPSSPWSFDPVEFPSLASHEGWFYILYGRLLRPTVEGTLEPDLAESTSVVDANTIAIELREGQVFSDGTPFDAAAVKAGLERSLTLATPAGFGDGFFALKTITVDGPTSLRLGIDGTAASWHDTYLPSFQTTIVKADGFDPSAPIGAGPFTLESYEAAKSAEYARSDSYWESDAITLAGIELVQVANATVEAGTNALKAEQVDVSLTDAAQIPALTGAVGLYTQPDANQGVTLMMCKASGPLADARVRVAINKALDRESISAAVYADTAEPALGMWPADHRFADPSAGEELAYDVEGAKALLAEAGYADGFDIELYSISVLGLPAAAEVIEQQLAEVGIRASISVTTNFVPDYLGVNKPGLGLYPSSSAGVDKLNQWSGESLVNTCDYKNDELDAVRSQLQRVTQTSDEAVELWRDASDVVVGDALSGFVLFRSILAGYNNETVGALSLWPKGSVITPNPRETWMTAS